MSRASITARWLGALCLASLTFATPIAAQTGDVAVAAPGARDAELDERARIHFHAGTDYFERGDYENALRELEIAHQMSGRPALLYNIGACLERMGRLVEAADRLEAYVAAARPDDAAAITERAQRLRARVAAQTSASGSEMSGSETAGSETAGSETLGDASTSDTSRTPSGGRTPHVASWIVLGVGGAALAGFAVLGGLALAEDGALASRCGTSCSRADVGTLSLTAGLVLVAVGVVLALVTDDGSAEHAGLELGPGGVGARF
jgi:tetratricopeptide (TPR) repeat protein